MSNYLKNIHFLRLLFFAGLLLTVVTCKKERAVRPFPRVLTGEVTDISKEGVRFHGEILALGSEPVLDHGFVVDYKKDPRLETGKVFSLGPADRTGAFDAYVLSSFKKSTLYYVLTFLKTKDYIVYGPIVTFTSAGSNPATVTAISPSEGTWGDTLLIRGNLFSGYMEDNKVFFDTIQADLLSASDTLLIVTVPFQLTEIHSKISVSVFDQSASSPFYFDLLPPVIRGLSPDHGFFGDTLAVSGENFYPDTSRNKVFIANRPCTITAASGKLLKVIVPASLPEGMQNIRVVVDDFSVTGENIFYSASPKLNNISPAGGTFLDTLTLHGINFHAEKENISLTLNDIQTLVVFWSDTLIRTIIPTSLNTSVSQIMLTLEGEDYILPAAFTLYPPLIEKVSPDTILFNQGVTIKGRYFNPEMEKNSVLIGGIRSRVLFASSDSLSVIAPLSMDATTGNVSLELHIGELQTKWYHPLIIPRPVITELSADSGIIGEKLVIFGKNFNPSFSFNKIFFGDAEGDAYFSRSSQINLYIPENTPVSSALSVSVNNQTSAAVNFALKPMTVDQVSPNIVYRGSIVTIRGKNFCSHPENGKIMNNIFFPTDTSLIVPFEFSSEILKFMVPDRPVSEGEHTLIIKLGVQEEILENKLIFHEPWREVRDFSQKFRASCSQIGSRVYLTQGNELWEYDIKSDNLRLLGSPDINFSNPLSFVIEDTVYFCDQNVFQAYFPSTGKWEKIEGNPYFSYRTMVFSLLGNGFALIYNSSQDNLKFWKYIPEERKWIQQTSNLSVFPYGNTFVISNHAYIITGRGELYSYDYYSEEWSQKQSCDFGPVRYGVVSYSVGNKGFAGLGNSYDYLFYSDMYRYDPSSDSWEKVANGLKPLSYVFSFSWNGKGYVGGGWDALNHENHTLYEFNADK